MLYNAFETNYCQLLDKAKKNTMTMERYPCLCLEIYKRMNYLNSGFVTDNFKLSDLKKYLQKQNLLNLNTTRPSQVSYGEKRLRVLCPKI